ncbi:hypothetical protein CFK37_13435 [Virgibacillus phasianinus]|uniref:LysM domain-containing protein n=1 Tax=Virgibacillus phasianinus TaxID=2017483 RepID=A0A220U589_9BACI|nr:SafA/ExsA family spore coat assembly protein [Virgibacillus phasianinus]ASK63076.1 hypothetical protein CFK37_13435 [Virgibacillus phasianinus]
MKIHIVKKGDTLWEIAKMYDVNFEQLKELNSQLSSPDMIMPGMKIKVPSNAKPVKKEEVQAKEKEMVKTPYKDISPKPLPVIKEDEKEKPEMKPNPMMPQQKPMMQQKPPMYQMPPIDNDMYNYTTINFSQMPQPEKKEVKHKEKKQPKPAPMPMPNPMMPEHMHMPMVPMCCYPMHPMQMNQMPMHHQMQPMHHQMHPMHHGNASPMQMQHKPMPCKQCGCAGEKPPFHHHVNNMYDDLPEMEMPKKPEHNNMECDDKNNHHYGKFNQPYPKWG